MPVTSSLGTNAIVQFSIGPQCMYFYLYIAAHTIQDLSYSYGLQTETVSIYNSSSARGINLCTYLTFPLSCFI